MQLGPTPWGDSRSKRNVIEHTWLNCNGATHIEEIHSERELRPDWREIVTQVDSMASLSHVDHLAIRQLINAVAFAFDSADFETELPALVTRDVHYENPGKVRLTSVRELIDTLTTLPNRAVSHHVSTTVVTPQDDTTTLCRSKVITYRPNGTHDVAEFVDTVVTDGSTWKLARRVVHPIQFDRGAGEQL